MHSGTGGRTRRVVVTAVAIVLLGGCGTGGRPDPAASSPADLDTPPVSESATSSTTDSAPTGGPSDSGSPGSPSSATAAGSPSDPGNSDSAAPSSGPGSPGSASDTPISPGSASDTPISPTPISPAPTSAAPTSPGSTNPTPISPAPTNPASTNPGPVLCGGATPVRVQQVATGPQRTTEVVTVVSDGKTVTPGTREQSDFTPPTLQGPDGTTDSDRSRTARVVGLVAATGRSRVLTSRPAAPDSQVDVSRRPFSTPGTYALYNASARLTASVVVRCSGQDQRWTFLGESDPAEGQVNCAVAPPRANALARLVYASSC